MTSNAIATNWNFAVRANWPRRLAIVAILTVLADWLFFRQAIGLSLAIFMLAVGAGVLLANRFEATQRELLFYSGILVAAVLPILEDFNAMSALIAVFGLGTFALGVSSALSGDLKGKLIAVGWFLVSGPFQWIKDLSAFREWARRRGDPVSLAGLQGWIIPLLFGAIFLGLFAAANPLIANWLAQWNIGEIIKQIDTQRLTFWFGTIFVVWAFVCVGGRFALPSRDERVTAATADSPPNSSLDLIFNDAAIMRSLILFNLLFAVQTIMDFQYLWRGVALPDGMSYASYAHRGAYPLIVTALLAAAFVIVAMRPGSDAERSPAMRALVCLWVGQNVLLVVSSILRLDLYVGIYLLTYWRVAAFIWMLIVAAGLLLIVVRIVTYRSNTWLASANLALLVLTIYVCSLVNFANLVASYNVSHSGDSATAGQPIDLTYLAELGPQAIPALDQYLVAHPTLAPEIIRVRRNWLAATHLNDSRSWRAWTLRGWRLTRYLQESKARP